MTLDRVAQRAHDQLGVGYALHQVVLRAEAQRAHGELLVRLRRHRDDRHGGRGDARARERFEPLPFLEREIEQHCVEAVVAEPPQARPRRSRASATSKRTSREAREQAPQ